MGDINTQVEQQRYTMTPTYKSRMFPDELDNGADVVK